MRTHKYNAKKTVVDNVTFDSKAEARRYQELKLLEQAGEIQGLQLQPQFILLEPFIDSSGKRQRPIIYKADFQYKENGQDMVEDVKGVLTPEFKLKVKLFLHKYPQYQFRVTK